MNRLIRQHIIPQSSSMQQWIAWVAELEFKSSPNKNNIRIFK